MTQCQSVTLEFQSISARIRDIESCLLTPRLNEVAIARQVREIQVLERSHLEKRVVINDKMVKLAQQLYEMNKRRYIEKREMEEAEITEFVAPRAQEIDVLKREESVVLAEINELVESLRRKATKDGADD